MTEFKSPVFYFKTLGCRLNQAEEESLRRQVLESSFLISENPEDADFVIVNSCSVTAVADRKTRQMIKQSKIKNRKSKIILVGCGAKAAKGCLEVNLIIANRDKLDALKMIMKKFAVKMPNYKYQITNKSKNPNDEKLKHKTIQASKTINENQSKRTRALLKIQDGCNNFCAYCIVPYLRGREVSVPVADVILEAKKLEEMGYKELVLSGVNVGRYHSQVKIKNEKVKKDTVVILSESTSRRIPLQQVQNSASVNLTTLIRLILKETNFPRIRLSSINPQDITDEMIKLWAGEPRLCRHFHLSLQSGSDGVLKRMGRPYSVQKYYSLSKKIVQKLPDMAITTDVIVGFPGETKAEFAETCNFVYKVGFAKLHVFRYSPRPGTRAAEMPNQVSDTLKTRRSKELIEISKELESNFKNHFLGREMEVLFEEKKSQKGSTLSSKRVEPSQEMEWYGLTSNCIRVKYKSGTDLQNQLRKIKLKKENLA